MTALNSSHSLQSQRCSSIDIAGTFSVSPCSDIAKGSDLGVDVDRLQSPHVNDKKLHQPPSSNPSYKYVKNPPNRLASPLDPQIAPSADGEPQHSSGALHGNEETENKLLFHEFPMMSTLVNRMIQMMMSIPVFHRPIGRRLILSIPLLLNST